MGAICIGDTFFITDDGADYVTGMLEWNCAVYFQETLFIIQYIEQLFKRVESKATEHRKKYHANIPHHHHTHKNNRSCYRM